MNDFLEKKIYTREEFEAERKYFSERMQEDSCLKKDAFEIMMRADKYNYFHQMNWMGEPIIQAPEDILAIQEIVFKTKPDFIIECGVCWGGGLLFCASLLKMIGGKEAIGVDVYIPEPLEARLVSAGDKYDLSLSLVKGSSIDLNIIQIIREKVKDSKCMVILDSDHTHDHVLEELRLYKEFVPIGGYMVCSDTMVDEIPSNTTNERGHELSPRNRNRPWGPGNNPRTALKEFLSEESKFVVDEYYRSKLLVSCNPDGYLLKIG